MQVESIHITTWTNDSTDLIDLNVDIRTEEGLDWSFEERVEARVANRIFDYFFKQAVERLPDVMPKKIGFKK